MLFVFWIFLKVIIFIPYFSWLSYVNHYIFSELLIKVSITRQWLLLILGAYYTVTFQDYQVSLHGLFKHWASLGTMRNLFTAAGSTKVKLIRGWHNWLIGKACHGEVVLQNNYLTFITLFNVATRGRSYVAIPGLIFTKNLSIVHDTKGEKTSLL